MLDARFRATLMGLAVSASLFGCAHQPAVSDQAAASAQTVGARLAEQDREREQHQRAEIGRVVAVSRISVKEDDRWIRIVYTLRNLSTKTIARYDVAFEAHRPGDSEPFATTEFHEQTHLAPHQNQIVTLEAPYTHFGSDTGAMREALGKPQRFDVYVKWMKFADGSESGYDD